MTENRGGDDGEVRAGMTEVARGAVLGGLNGEIPAASAGMTELAGRGYDGIFLRG